MAGGEWEVQYDDKTQELVVTFPEGRSYVYGGVPPDIAERFGKADSKGTFFNTYIRGVY